MKKRTCTIALLLSATRIIACVAIYYVNSVKKQLLYDEYFKEERGFHHQGFNPIFDDLHVFIYTKGGWHWGTEGLTLGYLYSYGVYSGWGHNNVCCQ